MSTESITHESKTGGDLAAARKTTGITIMLLVLLTAAIVSVTDVPSPWLQILACSPVVPALMYFVYASRGR
jgi:hypothetical protein